MRKFFDVKYIRFDEIPKEFWEEYDKKIRDFLKNNTLEETLGNYAVKPFEEWEVITNYRDKLNKNRNELTDIINIS